jgi:hypothetical protein
MQQVVLVELPRLGNRLGTGRNRSHRKFCVQRAHDALESEIRQSAGVRRGLRRARAVVVP